MSDQVPQLQSAIDEFQTALEGQRFDHALEIYRDLSPGDQVDLFNQLEEDQQTDLIHRLGVESAADLFDRLTDSETLDAAEDLPVPLLADILDEMEPDEAADLLGDLPPEQASQALSQMEESEDVLPLLGFADETAGGRMTTEFVALERNTTIQAALETLRSLSPDDTAPYYIFVVDREQRLAGVLGLRQLVIASPSTKVEDVMDPDVIFVTADTDQEDAAREMVRHDLSSIPVLDDRHHLLGVITHDDILDVISEEATEDIYGLANVTDIGLEPESPVGAHLRGRLPWLYLNSLTALFAAWVISHFENIIAQVAVLAVFQGVVAGQGGNAAMQSVAMMVRSMALGKVVPRRTRQIILREMLVGLLQGLAVGIVLGTGVAIWRGNVYLGLVLALSLVGNMLVAGVVGSSIPLLLQKIGLDPALASSIFVTAVTDSMGFFIFLSLAGHFLGNLI